MQTYEAGGEGVGDGGEEQGGAGGRGEEGGRGVEASKDVQTMEGCELTECCVGERERDSDHSMKMKHALEEEVNYNY